MRKYSHVIPVLLLLAAALWSISPGNAGAADFEHGLLWRVSKGATVAGYVLGTIHSEDARIDAVVDAVSPFLRESRVFALEINMDEATTRFMQQAMLLPVGQQLAQLTGADMYRAVSTVAHAHGLPDSLLTRLKPWALSVMLSMPPATTGAFLDIKLYRLAQQGHKQLHALETPAQHLEALENLSLDDQLILLAQTVRDYHDLDAINGALHQAYLRQDLRRLQQINDKVLARGDARVGALLMQQLVVQRNARMAARLREIFTTQSCFAAVGALHLPGADGVLSLLRAQGFQVTPVALQLIAD